MTERKQDIRGDYRNNSGGGGGVIEQLSRVMAGCANLLRLRGTVGEGEQHALRVMSERGSPALLAAVEAYGANQDLEVRTERVFSCGVSVPSAVHSLLCVWEEDRLLPV